MNFTTNKGLFSAEFEKVKSLINIEKELPDQVFRKSYSRFLIMEEAIFISDFFQRIKTFLTSIGEKEFSLLVIDPHPEKYFYKHSHKYPLIKISIENTTDEFISILNEGLGDSPAVCTGDSSAFCIGVVAHKMVLYSESNNLLMYTDRELEMAIAVFNDDKVEEAFVSSYGEKWIFSAEGAVDNILSLVFYGVEIPQDIIDKLHLNYG